MNQIWLGPLLGNNRSLLIERCAKLVASNEGHAFVYLAASQPLLEIATQNILDGELNAGVWGELQVFLFRGFVRRLLSTLEDSNGRGLPPRIPIDREELPLKRSLIAQILARLLDQSKLRAIAPLARREGCINTITTLIGEIERAAKTPNELSDIIAARVQDLSPQRGETISQLDFDNEVALIYSTYCELLNENQFTEDNADQLRLVSLLKNETGLRVPWLSQVRLLVLDGFFDFTPVQGEILRQVIPRIPEVIVNLNHDARNPEIFAPFEETIGQLQAIAPFQTIQTLEAAPTKGALSKLRVNLFNPTLSSLDEEHAPDVTVESQSGERSEDESPPNQSEIRFFECGDLDTEIRQIAREIKRQVVAENYNLADIGLVVRERAAYAQTIARVMREEGLPCNLEARVEAIDTPAIRAALKLFSLIEQLSADEPTALRISEIADLVKSEYFRLEKSEVRSLTSKFDAQYLELLSDDGRPLDATREKQLKRRYHIGVWDADALENAFAYVGSELRVTDWLARAGRLVKELPSATATREILNIDAGAFDRDADIADNLENAETAKLEENIAEKKRRPSRDIHPSTLAWTSLVIARLTEFLQLVPREGHPAELRSGVMKLLDQLSFRKQVAGPITAIGEDREPPQLLLNFNALESIRRAMAAAVKSIELTSALTPTATTATKLAVFIDEVRRSLSSQSQLLGSADRAGLRVLEATDVRGLRFRAVFIAGLIEGGFPLRTSRDWIYPHDERERLKKYGLTLEDISPATLLKEEHYFYQAACRATERLYLSRPLLLEDDSETVASYYVDELRRAITPSKLEAEPVRRNYEGQNREDVSSPNELKIALVRQQERHRHRGPKKGLLPQPRIKRLLTLARNDKILGETALRRIEIERERAGSKFGSYDGQITDPRLLAMLRDKFGNDYVHSASGLSVYGNCAYRFFAQRVIKLEPRGEAALDLQAIDAGKLLHDILRRFFENHRRERLHLRDRYKLSVELASIADRVFDEHERVVPPLNKQIWKIDREIRKILLDQVLLYELEMQEKTAEKDILPALFEVSFGGTRSAARDPASVEQPLELSRSTFVGEESIKISGQIDRVDLARDQTMVAYDYKLSLGSTREDIKSGRSLQIPIYLEALERLILPNHSIAGGGYYIIRGGHDRRNKGLYRASQMGYVKLQAKSSVFSDEDWQQLRNEVIGKIWEFLDRIREGNFIVKPSEKDKTCRFCDFGAVCRYERYRIDGKRETNE